MPRTAPRTAAASRLPAMETRTTTLPLGSLTQIDPRTRRSCTRCASPRVTHLSMSLTDGSPVDFVSCHTCESRTWQTATGDVLDMSAVLQRTRKPALAAS